MMKREELKEDMMEQVNGGSYEVKIVDPECSGYLYYVTIGKFTFKDEMLDSVKVLTDHGMIVNVDRTTIFDDYGVCGTYTKNGFIQYNEFFGI